MTRPSSLIDLAGTAWWLRSDPGNVGLAETWWNEPLRQPPWKSAVIPAAWQTEKGGDLGTHYHYLAWYRRTVEIPRDWPWPRTFLRFEAVATHARIWINGVEIGSHTGDFLPFEFDLTAHTRPAAPIEILVRVDELLGHITKGFHDMLSLHHGGLWQGVYLIGAGNFHPIPDGISINADVKTGRVHVALELSDNNSAAATTGTCSAAILDPTGKEVARSQSAISPATAANCRLELGVLSPQLWSPDHPALYTAVIDCRDSAGFTESHRISFGFRSLETVGTRILLNGSPFHLRGILHWGHEPRHVAPAPPPDQVRAEFATLRAMGFNAVCLCMWYPPRYYFDIADQTGMVIWQEHPVWHSPMDDELQPEYRRLYAGLMRRDRNHPSVFIVSATCEHPKFHPDLAKWWWDAARRTLPGKLLQVQTSSFAWSDPAQTDLYDEHTYDNNNRWVTYLRDLQDTLASMPVQKPFVMGETILFTSWPDVAAIHAAIGSTKPWWLPAYFDDAVKWESHWRATYGDDVVQRFRRQGDRHHLLGRKFQIECFRAYLNHAGLVTNHLRDVPGCTCGFLDDLDRWRFSPDQTRGWLVDAPILLHTPDHRRSFTAGESITASIAVSNFSRIPVRAPATITLTTASDRASHTCISNEISAIPGDIGSAPIRLSLPAATHPTRITLHCEIPNLIPNSWDNLWLFPEVAPLPPGVFRIDGLPFTPADAAPDELERGYSRGFGLPVKTWINRLPDPATLLPAAPPWPHDQPIPPQARVILTHRLTRPLIDFMSDKNRAGSVILLASKAPGALGTIYEWFFGQRPLILENNNGPLHPGDSDWIVDLLSFDLTRTYARMIPVETLGLLDHVDPIIRLVYTHDSSRVRFFDMLFTARVGNGRLIVTSLDHHDPAGQYLLHQLINSASAPDEFSGNGELAPNHLIQFAIDR